MSRSDAAFQLWNPATLSADALSGAGESWYDKALREAQLARDGVAGGFVAAAKEARQDLETSLYQQLSAFALGTALSSLSSRPGMIGIAANGVGAALTGAFLWELATPQRWSQLGIAVADTWDSPRHYAANVEAVQNNLGRLAFNTAFMTLGGIAGAKTGEKLAARWQSRNSALLASHHPALDLAFVQNTNFTPTESVHAAISGIKAGSADQIALLAHKDAAVAIFERMMGTKAWNQGHLHHNSLTAVRDLVQREAHGAVLEKGTGLLTAFEDSGFITRKLSEDPVALAKYERYAAAKKALDAMNNTDWAYGDRIPVLSDTLGMLNKKLGLPPVKVIPETDPTGWAAAFYRMGTGEIRVAPHNLGSASKSTVAELLSHEQTHLEQDALVIRRIAQKLGIKGSLNNSQADLLAAQYETTLGIAPQPEYLSKVIEHSQGQLLTPAEIARADRLIASLKENISDGPLHEARRVEYAQLKKTAEDLQWGRMSVKKFLEKEQLTPEESQNALVKFLLGKLNEPGRTWTRKDEQQYVTAALDVIHFRQKAALPQIMADQARYLNWEHEREAYTVGTTIRELMDGKINASASQSSVELA